MKIAWASSLKRCRYHLILFFLGLVTGAVGSAYTLSHFEAQFATEDTLLYLLGGDLAREAGKMEQAIAFYNRAIGRVPQWYEGHYQLGLIYLAQDKPHLAVPELEMALKCAKAGSGAFGREPALFDASGIEAKLEKVRRLAAEPQDNTEDETARNGH